ncbi:glycosyltransferase family 4 protein [Alkalilimnicola ehrlichii MLHE-1]|uniref:Glycosyl transferase, group 1 n=1 Tax=Alkalilimnicola ehrlichii (strain ATCC BAA-1101 / DSM 17681 / MLHE-1) TaxID=187272 RepID=Q0A647_ALKEH|nr:glycosyltransferase family 4 protein [Alkalilimnicola ehrlichii]ABI57690.1 glycosyl transferase, group 1 [Alkalilimnicola ehrlichii MLHE-1]
MSIEPIRPVLVYVTPVMPAPTGGGRQMRAWQFLLHYAARYRITLVVADHRGPVPPAVQARVAECLLLQPARRPGALALRLYGRLPVALRARLWPGRPLVPRLAAMSRPAALRRALARADAVCVFRLYSLPLVQPLLPRHRPPPLWLDLDDWESRTLGRIAALARENGWHLAARDHRAQQRVAERWERRELPRADRVFVCSAADQTALAEAYPGVRPEVVPNRYCGAIAPALTPEAVDRRREGYRVLFVGSMGYLPNQDAVLWFARHVLPRAREALRRPLQFHIVGPGLPPWLRDELAGHCGVVCHGYAPDLGPHYRQADLVVCPVRAGGGTRIKILEAVARRRAVVTTTPGVEGLDFRAGEMAVVDGVAAFASATRALLSRPERRASLADRALQRLRRDYWLSPVGEGPARQRSTGTSMQHR